MNPAMTPDIFLTGSVILMGGAVVCLVAITGLLALFALRR